MTIPTFHSVAEALPSIVTEISRSGVLRIHSCVPEMELLLLNEEFEGVHNFPNPPAVNPIKLEIGRGAAVQLNAVAEQFPTMHRFFSQAWMQRVADDYWGGPSDLNASIYVMHEVVGTTHVAQDLHFDVQRTYKFFLYLNDVTAENGAFSCVPGSHTHTTSVREKLGDQITYENRYLSREHPYSEDLILPVEGPAGTLIIFTTEVWHRAGIVRSGERRVMRGHTRAKPAPPATPPASAASTADATA